MFKNLLILSLMIYTICLPSGSQAKIAPPPQVAPVYLNNYEFRAPNDRPGMLEIWNAKTKTEIEEVKIYEPFEGNHNPKLEDDVQWHFIKKLSLSEDGTNLEIRTDKNLYLYNLETRKIRLIPRTFMQRLFGISN